MKSLLAAVLLAAPALSSADEPAPTGYTLYNTQVRILHSERVGIDYKLYIGLPRNYEAKSDSYPVVMILDADTCFAITHGAFGLLADRDELPPAILVGIAYPGVAEEKHGPTYKLNRTRDYTPSHMDKGGYGEEYQKFSGGGDRFLDFLSQELAPYLEREFRIRRNDRTLIGYSYGGLLASYALLTRPGLFQRLIIVSPSLWWDEHLIAKIEAGKAPLRKDIAATVYMTVGERETGDMAKDLNAFADKLRSRHYPGLRLSAWIAPDETHHSNFPGAVMRGIRWVFSN